MKLYKVVLDGANSTLKLYDIKKRKSAKKLLAEYPTLFYKSFGKARKALTQGYKDKIKALKAELKQIRSVKKKGLQVVNITVADKMKGYETLKEQAALIPALVPSVKKEKKAKKVKKSKKGKK